MILIGAKQTIDDIANINIDKYQDIRKPYDNDKNKAITNNEKKKLDEYVTINNDINTNVETFSESINYELDNGTKNAIKWGNHETWQSPPIIPNRRWSTFKNKTSPRYSNYVPRKIGTITNIKYTGDYLSNFTYSIKRPGSKESSNKILEITKYFQKRINDLENLKKENQRLITKELGKCKSIENKSNYGEIYNKSSLNFVINKRLHNDIRNIKIENKNISKNFRIDGGIVSTTFKFNTHFLINTSNESNKEKEKLKYESIIINEFQPYEMLTIADILEGAR